MEEEKLYDWQIDERMKWFEQCICSSLKPRNEDIRNMLSDNENRLAFYDFLNNEDTQRIFIYVRSERITASLSPPYELLGKSICFFKHNTGRKITKFNIDEEVSYLDCDSTPLNHLQLLINEVYIPLLCNKSEVNKDYNEDKMLDILHRLLASVEVAQGQVEGKVVLALPSIEVLSDAAEFTDRRPAFMHLLETIVIMWIKQIKDLLHFDAIKDLYEQFGPEPGLLDEMRIWKNHLELLNSVLTQFDSEIPQKIFNSLHQDDNQYAHSLVHVRKEITKEITETEQILKFISTIIPWHSKIDEQSDLVVIQYLFKPLMKVVSLIWSYSSYYHQKGTFNNLLEIMCNDTVRVARNIVGEYVLEEPLKSYCKLRDALEVCATFRGTYLDFKEEADEINKIKREMYEHRNPKSTEEKLFCARLYNVSAYKRRFGIGSCQEIKGCAYPESEELLKESSWPVRNAPCFNHLNSFIERCNDVLELVETVQHFHRLSGIAVGVGDYFFDSTLREIDQKYNLTMNEFFSSVKNVLDIKETQLFEQSFFRFRIVIKTLEDQLAEIIRKAFQQCALICTKLRLLEVFQGIASRHRIKKYINDLIEELVQEMIDDVAETQELFKAGQRETPPHCNLPSLINKVMWVRSLQERIKEPVMKLNRVCSSALEEDIGRQLKDDFNRALSCFQNYESQLIDEWQNGIPLQLTNKLKLPLLSIEDYDEEVYERPHDISLSLDPELLILLKEIHYLTQDPFNVQLSYHVKEVLRKARATELHVAATRLETVVIKYRAIMRTLTDIEKPLFDDRLFKIDQLISNGSKTYTWKMTESLDFIETIIAVVCGDVFPSLNTLQLNGQQIFDITRSWSEEKENVFKNRDHTAFSYKMDDLLALQKSVAEYHKDVMIPSGNKIHSLLKSSLEAVQISEASPAWQDYVIHMDIIVLEGLKKAILSDLQSIHLVLAGNQIDQVLSAIPIVTIDMILVENKVTFHPPLDQNSCIMCVKEVIMQWVEGFLGQAKHIKMIISEGNFEEFINGNDEIKWIVADITNLIDATTEECEKMVKPFDKHSLLWTEDIQHVFETFLKEIRTSVSKEQSEHDSDKQIGFISESSVTPSTSQCDLELISPFHDYETSITLTECALSCFESQLKMYQDAIEEISSFPDYKDIGWIRVNLQPIRQMGIMYARKGIWTYTEYLKQQINFILENLNTFMTRIETQIESITWQENDSIAFLKIMRLFIEVSAQKHEMDKTFIFITKTLSLLEKYDEPLSQKMKTFCEVLPSRWNNLKSKVSLVRQRIGPRIQQESNRIMKDLEAFSQHLRSVHEEIENSYVFKPECTFSLAQELIDGFCAKLAGLENEAQDFLELQKLLEKSVIDYSVLNQLHELLACLKKMWETIRIIDEMQRKWKVQKWHKMDFESLQNEILTQFEIIHSLPENVHDWDIYITLQNRIMVIQACLPLVVDLNNPAIRPRHWKQIFNVTGEKFCLNIDIFKRTTLENLLTSELQAHIDDVRFIVQRAIKDLEIEMALKTYEEVWLSKTFELRIYNFSRNDGHINYEGKAIKDELILTSQYELDSLHNTKKIWGEQNISMIAMATSVASFDSTEDICIVSLLTNTENIFEELQDHLQTLQTIQSSKVAGAFLDEVMKWQSRLLNIESVLTLWLRVQAKWFDLVEIFSSPDIQKNFPGETKRFQTVHSCFYKLMEETNMNSNIMQCCSKKNIVRILETMDYNLEKCNKALLKQLEQRRQLFPRFYFISAQDLLNILSCCCELKLMAVYLKKLFPNIGGLIYDTKDNGSTVVKGVHSILKENLEFQQPFDSDGPVERELALLLSSIKTALQLQLTRALVFNTDNNKGKQLLHEELPEEKGDSTNVFLQSGKEYVDIEICGDNVEEKTSNINLLKNYVTTEMLCLATLIEKTKLIEEALEEMNESNKNALQNVLCQIDIEIGTASEVLSGIKRERNKRRKLRLERNKNINNTSNKEEFLEVTDSEELKNELYPSQLHKISCLLLLLAYFQELVGKLLSLIETDTKPQDYFGWRIQLKYSYDDDQNEAFIKCLNSCFKYGFEYLGSAKRHIVVMSSVKYFASVLQLISIHVGSLITGPLDGYKKEILTELSYCLGQPLYFVNCIMEVQLSTLQDIMVGVALTGCWICFNNMNHLLTRTMNHLTSIISSLLNSLRTGKHFVKFEVEEVPLNPNAACFALIDNTVSFETFDPKKLSLYPAAHSTLPKTVLEQFRVISIIQPSLKQFLEVTFLSLGFSYGHIFSEQMMTILDTTEKMLGTNSIFHIDSNVLNTNIFGRRCNLKTMIKIIEEASDCLHENIEEILTNSKYKLEQMNLTKAIVNFMLPQLPYQDAIIFESIAKHVWPNVDIQQLCHSIYDTPSTTPSQSVASLVKSLSPSEDIGDENLSHLTDTVITGKGNSTQNTSLCSLHVESKIQMNTQESGNLDFAISAAINELDLFHGAMFHGRVVQLAHICKVTSSILVVGPAGCGKSTCIKTYAAAQKEMGKSATIHRLFIKAVEPEDLMGYTNHETKEWKDGLLPTVLRKVCNRALLDYDPSAELPLKIIHLDGECSSYNMDILQTFLDHDGLLILANCERIIIPDNVCFIWELDTLCHLSPAHICKVGVILMNSTDVGWRTMLVHWLESCPESYKEELSSFIHIYMERIIHYVIENTETLADNFTSKRFLHSKRMINHSVENMISTFCALWTALVSSFINISEYEYMHCFNFACIWAFGGTLEKDGRELFNVWWRQQFHQIVDFPEEGTVFDYVMDSKTSNFILWTNYLPSYVTPACSGIPEEAFVHTVCVEQMTYLLSLLGDVNSSVLLVGEEGCGKTAIVKDRVNSVCLGGIAEVQSLTVHANRFVNSRWLQQLLEEHLSKTYGDTYVPKGGKKLLFFLDDFYLCKEDSCGYQTALDLIRQLVDDSGYYSSEDYSWRYVQNVFFVATTISNSKYISVFDQRLLRHFSIFGCLYPRAKELEYMFSTMLQCHFIMPVSSSLSYTSYILPIEEQGDLKDMLKTIVQASVELHFKLKTMFLPTQQRCHYIFTIKDLTRIFKNLCLSLSWDCSTKYLLLLWQHECLWVFGYRMYNEVDLKRFHEVFKDIIRKNFTDEKQIEMLLNLKTSLFCNLVKSDSGVVMTKSKELQISNKGLKSGNEWQNDMYRIIDQPNIIQQELIKELKDHNKVYPPMKIFFYKSSIEKICRLSRAFASPHELANTVIVTDGTPGLTTNIVRFSAYLCGYDIVQIHAAQSDILLTKKLTFFKKELGKKYIEAGVKGKRLLLLIKDEELLSADFFEYLVQYMTFGSIDDVFSYDQRTSIINSIRSDIIQVGLTYTREVAWNFFLRNLKENFHICLLFGAGGEGFQKCCHNFPALVKSTNFLWSSHWTKKTLIRNAKYHVKCLTWLHHKHQENISHLLASMHLALIQQEGKKNSIDQYRHINDTNFERFVDKFVHMANERYDAVKADHKLFAYAYGQMSFGEREAERISENLEHEMVILTERQNGAKKLLTQMGQDSVIREHQLKIIKSQKIKILQWRKLLPEYQIAHERALFKAVQTVADTKKEIQKMNMESLAFLRSITKPSSEVLDVLAAVIIILKSPSADQSWQKGAKRLMANMNKFVEELMSFDEYTIPESTLCLLENFLKRTSFTPESVIQKTGNEACETLCRWIIGVVRYHNLMMRRVKPLHEKVNKTSENINGAVHKKNILENKYEELNVRLGVLAQSFEKTTIDMKQQETATANMKQLLDVSVKLLEVITAEKQKCKQIIESLDSRLVAIPGSTAIAAGFVIYLGPYHHSFRKTMLTRQWPACLKDRGIPLVVDSIDIIKGRVVDWSVDCLKTAAGADNPFDVNILDFATSKFNLAEIGVAKVSNFEIKDEKESSSASEETAEEVKEKSLKIDAEVSGDSENTEKTTTDVTDKLSVSSDEILMEIEERQQVKRMSEELEEIVEDQKKTEMVIEQQGIHKQKENREIKRKEFVKEVEQTEIEEEEELQENEPVGKVEKTETMEEEKLQESEPVAEVEKKETMEENEPVGDVETTEEEKLQENEPVGEVEKTETGEEEKLQENEPVEEVEKTEATEEEKLQENEPVEEVEKTEATEEEKLQENEPVEEVEKTEATEEEKLQENEPVEEVEKTETIEEEEMQENEPVGDVKKTETTEEEKLQENEPVEEVEKTETIEEEELQANEPVGEVEKTKTIEEEELQDNEPVGDVEKTETIEEEELQDNEAVEEVEKTETIEEEELQDNEPVGDVEKTETGEKEKLQENEPVEEVEKTETIEEEELQENEPVGDVEKTETTEEEELQENEPVGDVEKTETIEEEKLQENEPFGEVEKTEMGEEEKLLENEPVVEVEQIGMEEKLDQTVIEDKIVKKVKEEQEMKKKVKEEEREQEEIRIEKKEQAALAGEKRQDTRKKQEGQDKKNRMVRRKKQDTDEKESDFESSDTKNEVLIDNEPDEDDENACFKPAITQQQYQQYIRSLVKLLVGEKTLHDWIKKDYTVHQMENAAILWSSQDRPLMLIDPHGEGLIWLKRMTQEFHQKDLVHLDIEKGLNTCLIHSLEAAIRQGTPVLLWNCKEKGFDNILSPLLYHEYSSASSEEKNLLYFNCRRIKPPPGFHFYLSTPLKQPNLSPEFASLTTMVNFDVSSETLVENFLTRAFATLRPQLFNDWILAHKAIEELQLFLSNLGNIVSKNILAKKLEDIMKIKNSRSFILNIIEIKLKVNDQLEHLEKVVDNLLKKKQELLPLAHRAAILYSLIHCLSAVRIEYQFSLPYFVQLLDEILGNVPVKFKKVYYFNFLNEEMNEEYFSCASTAGVYKRVSQELSVSEVEVLPLLQKPEIAKLPTEGVDYTSWPENHLKYLVDNLTTNVFHAVQRSLYDEDWLLFETMLCLNIQLQNENVFSYEEMSLLLQGNPGFGTPVTLADFNCKENPPDWLPEESWKNVLALSLLPGLLDSLCVEIATNPIPWKYWYMAEHPEKLSLPVNTKMKVSSQTSLHSSSESLNNFYNLLLIRILRPDCLNDAVQEYVSKNLPCTLVWKNLTDIMADVNQCYGILLLLPQHYQTGERLSKFKTRELPVDSILRIAKEQGILALVLSVSDKSIDLLPSAIDDAMNKCSWLVIQDLHHASQLFLQKLMEHLQQIEWRINSHNKNTSNIIVKNLDKSFYQRFCVWLTYEPTIVLPDFYYKHLYKLAWYNLTNSENNHPPFDTDFIVQTPLPKQYLEMAILSTIREVSKEFWMKHEENTNEFVKVVAFAIIVAHSIIESRQSFGTEGLSHWYPLNAAQLKHVMEMVFHPTMKTKHDLQFLMQTIVEFIYKDFCDVNEDRLYIKTVFEDILNQVFINPSTTICIKDVEIPTPADNIYLFEMDCWFQMKCNEMKPDTLSALSICPNVVTEIKCIRTFQFLHSMEKLYEAQTMQESLLPMTKAKTIDIKLRSFLEVCQDEIPPLLDIGNISKQFSPNAFIPFQDVSCSISSSENILPYVGYVLLQECIWLNWQLTRIRTDISQIQQSMIGGSLGFSSSDIFNAMLLQEEFVPLKWEHPNCQPTVHTLGSWLADLERKYKQLNSLVQHKVVNVLLTPDATSSLQVLSLSHKDINNLQLGALVNPIALLTALKLEKAIAMNKSILQMEVILNIKNIDDTDDISEGITIRDIYLWGADWDYKEECLIPAKWLGTCFMAGYCWKILNVRFLLLQHCSQSYPREETWIIIDRSSINYIPTALLKILQKGEHQQHVEISKATVYDCPIYMSKHRQNSLGVIPLKCSKPVNQWILSGTALLLNPGMMDNNLASGGFYKDLTTKGTESEDGFSSSESCALPTSRCESMFPKGLSNSGSHIFYSYQPLVHNRDLTKLSKVLKDESDDILQVPDREQHSVRGSSTSQPDISETVNTSASKECRSLESVNIQSTLDSTSNDTIEKDSDI